MVDPIPMVDPLGLTLNSPPILCIPLAIAFAVGLYSHFLLFKVNA